MWQGRRDAACSCSSPTWCPSCTGTACSGAGGRDPPSSGDSSAWDWGDLSGHLSGHLSVRKLLFVAKLERSSIFGHQGDHDSYFVSVILFKVQQWTFIIYDIYTKTYITYYFVLILFDDDRRRDSAINATSCLGHSDSVELQYWWYTVHSSK